MNKFTYFNNNNIMTSENEFTILFSIYHKFLNIAKELK